MAKRRRETSTEVIARWVREGRGQGEGAGYTPWLQIQDVASKGFATRIFGWTTQRAHHLLSRLELSYFYLLDWAPIVTDIREQYPLLPQEETLAIAADLHVKHPADPRTRAAIVMTTDFLVTVRASSRDTERARSVKPSGGQLGLASERALEKLEIERRYWAARDIDWGIVTEREICAVAVANIAWVHSSRDLSALTSLTPGTVERVRRYLEPRLLAEDARLADVTDRCDDALGLEPGSALTAVRHLIATVRWRVDIRKPLSPAMSCQHLGALITPRQRAAGGERC
jgi:hypothetical protein